MEAVTRLEDAVRQVNLTSGQPSRQRASPRLQAALAWLQAHPEHLDTPSRQLREVIGVSHTTVHKAQQMLKDTGEES